MDKEGSPPDPREEDPSAETPKSKAHFTPTPRALPRRTMTEGGAPVTGVQTGIFIEPRKWEGADSEAAEPAAADEHAVVQLPNPRDSRMVQVFAEPAEQVVPFAQRRPAAGFLPRRHKVQDDGFEHWGERRQRLSWKWVAFACVGIAMMCLLVYRVQSRQGLSNTQAPVKAEALDATPTMNREDMDLKSDQMFFREHPDLVGKEGREVFLRYARAESAAEALECIRDRERLQATFEQEWKPWGGGRTWELKRTAVVGLATIDSSNYLLISDVRPGSEETFAACVIRKGGQMLVDWEASVGYCNPAFPKIVRGEGTTALARVTVELAHFYTALYPEADFQSFILANRASESDDVVWAYAPRDKPACQQLISDITKRKAMGKAQAERYTLQLRKGVAEAQKNQWLIDEVLYRDWVKP